MAKRGPKRQILDVKLNRFEGYTLARACLKARDAVMGEAKGTGKGKEDLSLMAMEAADYDMAAKKILKAVEALDHEKISQWANQGPGVAVNENHDAH